MQSFRFSYMWKNKGFLKYLQHMLTALYMYEDLKIPCNMLKLLKGPYEYTISLIFRLSFVSSAPCISPAAIIFSGICDAE